MSAETERGESLFWDATQQALVLQTDRHSYQLPPSALIRMEHKGLRKWDSIRLDCRPSELSELPLKLNRFPLNIKLVVDIGAPPAAHAAVALIALHNEKEFEFDHVPLRDQIVIDEEWYALVPDELSEIREILDKLAIPIPGRITMRQGMYLICLDSSLIVQRSLSPPNSLTSYPTPQYEARHVGIQAKLYPYQEAGVSWLSDIAREDFGCILADEMGLGKTLQVIALLTIWKTVWKAPSLIVAPVTLIENWRREIHKFSPSLDIHIHTGSSRTGFPSQLNPFDVVITSYDTVVRDQAMLGLVPWACIILDEAQAIKNPDTRRSQSVKALPRRVSIAVTGTPIENRLRDLWSIMDFACPGLLGETDNFIKELEETTEGAQQLERIVSPLILRRRVAEVARDLPDLIQVSQALALDQFEEVEYEQLRTDIIEVYGDAATLVALTKLKQYCCHPHVVDIRTEVDAESASTKYRRLCEILTEISEMNEKAIVFTSFQYMLDLIVSDIEERTDMVTFGIDGRTPVGDRQRIVDRFSDIQGPAIIALNPRAAGTGLNITCATHVIHYNLEWNPAVEDQATARAYRRGQTRPVVVYKLYYADTVEEVMNERLNRKRELADKAIVGMQPDIADKADVAAALLASPFTRTKVRQ